MSDSDAYESEMKDLHRDRAIDRLLAGKVIETDPESAELAALVADIEATYVQAVDPETEAAHVARIVEAARSQALEDRGRATEDRGRAVEDRGRVSDRGRTRPLRRLRPVALLAKFAAAAIGVSLLGGGLALAGVQLPGALGDAFDRLGGNAPEHVDSLPANGQNADATPAATPVGSAIADGLLDFIHSTDDKGCSFGQGVAAIASGGNGGNADACTNASTADNNGNNDGPRGSRATGGEASEGRSENAGEPRGSRETGTAAAEEHSQAPDVPAGSPATGTEASSGAANNAGEPRGSRETGEEAASGAADNGNGKGGPPSVSL